MITLGIETSCDETGVAVTSGRRVLSSTVTSSVHLHKKYGGVVPEIASRFHVEFIMEVMEAALKASKKRLKNINLVAVTNGPGLVGALLTGISLAKSLSYALDVPVIGVNHVLAHLYSSFLTERNVDFPFVGLVVSGGHTVLFYCEDIDRQCILGQTQDDAVGEAYDKVAKILGLGYPGGPVIEKTAIRSMGKNKIVFPKSYMGKDSLDFSFSGIKTAVLYYVRKMRRLDSGMVSDICRAFQEAALDVLVDKTCLACKMKNVKRILVGGGVAANLRLRHKLSEAAARSGIRVYFPELKYCLDNGAMIGALGEALYNKGRRSNLYLTAEPNLAA
ncbi:MAG: tRNA (adenosine(37)-N6)-threonylcarbamoyltransferase complex transferase subunit TsaD [Candidatus Omnitrophica bacterium]|nr:tRNA (adenosine(37)-N6)-threonylcarbamoyltransferase complex transferase subunit TsaD [Candidatus Omnitrophota bacterium]